MYPCDLFSSHLLSRMLLFFLFMQLWYVCTRVPLPMLGVNKIIFEKPHLVDCRSLIIFYICVCIIQVGEKIQQMFTNVPKSRQICVQSLLGMNTMWGNMQFKLRYIVLGCSRGCQQKLLRQKCQGSSSFHQSFRFHYLPFPHLRLDASGEPAIFRSLPETGKAIIGKRQHGPSSAF